MRQARGIILDISRRNFLETLLKGTAGVAIASTLTSCQKLTSEQKAAKQSLESQALLLVDFKASGSVKTQYPISLLVAAANSGTKNVTASQVATSFGKSPIEYDAFERPEFNPTIGFIQDNPIKTSDYVTILTAIAPHVLTKDKTKEFNNLNHNLGLRMSNDAALIVVTLPDKKVYLPVEILNTYQDTENVQPQVDNLATKYPGAGTVKNGQTLAYFEENISSKGSEFTIHKLDVSSIRSSRFAGYQVFQSAPTQLLSH